MFYCLAPYKLKTIWIDSLYIWYDPLQSYFILYVQEVVTHFSKLLYKMGHYFLDTQYMILFPIAVWVHKRYSLREIRHISTEKRVKLNSLEVNYLPGTSASGIRLCRRCSIVPKNISLQCSFGILFRKN